MFWGVEEREIGHVVTVLKYHISMCQVHGSCCDSKDVIQKEKVLVLPQSQYVQLLFQKTSSRRTLCGKLN